MTDLFPVIHADHPFVEGGAPRASVDELGYAFLRGVLDPDAVCTLRARLFEHVAAAGWLAAGRDPADAKPGPVVHDESDLDDFLPVYKQLQAPYAEDHSEFAELAARKPSRFSVES